MHTAQWCRQGNSRGMRGCSHGWLLPKAKGTHPSITQTSSPLWRFGRAVAFRVWEGIMRSRGREGAFGSFNCWIRPRSFRVDGTRRAVG